MLVHVSQSFAMTTLRKRKVRYGLFKYCDEYYLDYCISWVNFVCDESEVDEQITKHIKDKMAKEKDYDDYTFEIPPGRYSGQYENGYTFSPKIKYIKDMPMNEIVNLLTGEEFVRFLKETWVIDNDLV